MQMLSKTIIPCGRVSFDFGYMTTNALRIYEPGLLSAFRDSKGTWLCSDVGLT